VGVEPCSPRHWQRPWRTPRAPGWKGVLHITVQKRLAEVVFEAALLGRKEDSGVADLASGSDCPPVCFDSAGKTGICLSDNCTSASASSATRKHDSCSEFTLFLLLRVLRISFSMTFSTASRCAGEATPRCM